MSRDRANRVKEVGSRMWKAPSENGMPRDLAKLIARHRRWLGRLGLLGRPWLILGSAPDPNVPPELLRSHLRVDINNVGRTASSLGWGRADLTIRAKRKSWKEHPELDTRSLLWIHEFPPLLLRLVLLFKPHLHIGSVSTMSRRQRERLVAHVASTSLEGIGEFNKVTNGVAAACYGLALGVPQVVMAGISLSKTGHSYDDRGRARRQVDEDAYILDLIKDHPALFTTEAELADSPGLKLWSAEAAPPERLAEPPSTGY